MLRQLIFGLELLGYLLDLLDQDHVVLPALLELVVKALNLQILAGVSILPLQLVPLRHLFQLLVFHQKRAQLILNMLLLFLLLVLGVLELQDVRESLRIRLQVLERLQEVLELIIVLQHFEVHFIEAIVDSIDVQGDELDHLIQMLEGIGRLAVR